MLRRGTQGLRLLEPCHSRTLFQSSSSRGDEMTKTYGKVRIILKSEKEAEEFLRTLHVKERQLLLTALKEDQHLDDYEPIIILVEKNGINGSAISREQAKALFLINCLPFVGFGFLDNFIMIVAGEYIDTKLGVAFGLTTMAAAGFGNAISDVAGVGLAHWVEQLVGKVGITTPVLTAEQWESPRARRTSNVGKVLGLFVGCLLGMFPLIFYPSRPPPKNQSLLDEEEE